MCWENQAGDPSSAVELELGTILEQECQEVIEEIPLAVLKVPHVRHTTSNVLIEPFHSPQEDVLNF